MKYTEEDLNFLYKKNKFVEKKYYNDDDKCVDEDEATKMVINEYDENGILINSIYALLEKSENSNHKKH